MLPNPEITGDMYFFLNKSYAVIRCKQGTTNDFVLTGPKGISAYWPALRAGGFNTIDAVLPNPADDHKAYVFSGTRHALMYFNPGTFDDRIVDGPNDIWSDWPSLKKANFKTIDAVLPNPNNRETA